MDDDQVAISHLGYTFDNVSIFIREYNISKEVNKIIKFSICVLAVNNDQAMFSSDFEELRICNNKLNGCFFVSKVSFSRCVSIALSKDPG